MTGYAIASLVVMVGLTALAWAVGEFLAHKIGAAA